MNVIKSIITGLFISLFIIISTSFIVSFLYEDEISELFIRELNKRIDAEVKTEQVNLSLLQKFPGASVALKNFSLQTINKNDTTLTFSSEKVFLKFDVIDIFTKNIDIDRIDIQDGSLRLLLGTELTIRNKNRKNSNISLNLNSLNITNLKYTILNNDKNFHLEGHTVKTTIDGAISLNNKSLSVDSKSFVERLTINEFPYIKKKQLEFSGDIQDSPASIVLKQGTVNLENLPFEANGNYNKEYKTIALSVKGKNIKIPELKLYIPWKLREKYDNILFESGRLDLIAQINGSTQNTFPGIKIDFKLNEGKVDIKEDKNLTIRDISFSGYFDNGKLNQPKSSYLIFENINTKINNNQLKGKMEVHNFKNPSFKADGEIRSELQSFTKLLGISKLKHEKGDIEASFSFDTYLNEPINFARMVKQKRLTGDLTLKKISFRYNNFQISDLTGFTYLNNTSLHVNSIEGKINQTNDFHFKGTINNLDNHLLDSSQAFQINGNLTSNLINLNKLTNKEDSTKKKQLILPASIKGDLSLKINNLKWGNFFARSVRGNLNYMPQTLKLNEVFLKSLEGQATLNAELTQKKDKSFQLKSHSYLTHIDINEAFKVFNNFGQDYIIQENIKGFLTGDIYFASNLDQEFKIRSGSISNVSDFTIQNGELIQFEPMKSLSKFVKLSELKHINFSKLKNKITIKDQVVTIPEMDINSSAVDLTLEGHHTFEGSYKYRINLLLSEILRKKADKKVTEYGVISDDGVGKTKLYLVLEGREGNSEVRYDKERVKEKIRADIEEEKNELKTILNEEFGLFKNDTTLKVKKPETTRDFQIDWKEEGDKKDKKNLKIKDKKREKSEREFIIKWEEDTLKSY